MNAGNVFRAYDIRGVVDKDFNAEWVTHLGKACGTYLAGRGISSAVIGYDCRHSSPAYHDALVEGLLSTGIDVISSNMLLENETDPVIWRGPVIGGVVQQFWSDVLWDDVDYMFVDMPPGTGDVALNVFQSLPVDGVIIVASPQDLVSMVVQKAVKMAQMMNIPIVGLVENMSYVQCPDCGKKLYIFGEGKTEEAAKEYHIPLLAKMPIDPALAKLTDDGCIEQFEGHWLDGVVETILRK